MAGAYDGRRVLLTGATGFIGAHLRRRLAADGAIVHAVSREPQVATGPEEWWHGPLDDPDFVLATLSEVRPEVVFHLAGHVDGARHLDQVRPCLMGNLVTTVNLLTTATELGVDRIVLVGSLEEPGPGELATVPSSPYAASKWAAGDYARMFHALFGTPVVIARTFMVYGPGQIDGRKLVPYVTRALLRGVAPELSSATRPVDWIYVDDVVDGLLCLGATPGVGGETFDVGSGQLVPVRDVVLQLADIIRPAVQIQFGAVPDRPLEQVRVADAIDTKDRIGWEAQVALRDGLERSVKWYAEHP